MHGLELSVQDLKLLRMSGLGGKREGSLVLWLLLSYRPRIWEFALKLEALNSQGLGAFVVDSGACRVLGLGRDPGVFHEGFRFSGYSPPN